MFKRIAVFALGGLLFLNIYGCFALFAGAAAGGGTAVWLSNKLTQEVNAPYARTIEASEKALKSLNLEVAKKTQEEEVTQLRSEYTDGKEIWIDIRKVTNNSTKVEIRVGAISSDKEAASKILKKIQLYL